MSSSHGQQTIQGACVLETAVHDHGRHLNQREFRPMAEVPFPPARQLSKYKGKGASASREVISRLEGITEEISAFGFQVSLRASYSANTIKVDIF